MKIVVAGATGFVGRHLAARLLADGHEVWGTGTRPREAAPSCLTGNGRFTYVRADTTRPGDWQRAVSQADAVVNLAGRTIFHYWTSAYKKELRDSRILTTRHIVDALALSGERARPVVLLNTSAVGFYGPSGDEELTESAPAGRDFLAALSVDWEAEALRAADKGARVVIARFGIVLGPDDGAMPRMVPAFRWGLGGPLGSGRQWFSWIHIDDLVAAFGYCLNDERLSGPVNFTAPGALRQREFAFALGRALKRPALLPAPGIMIRALMGELGGILLSGQRVAPRALLDAGFAFTYPDAAGAVRDLLEKMRFLKTCH